MAESNLQLPGDFGLPATAPLYVGGLPVDDVLSATTFSTSKGKPKPQISPDHRFWASPPRLMTYPFSEGIIVNLAKAKKINYLSLDLPLFPYHFYMFYWDLKAKDWREFKGLTTGVVRIYVDGSTPSVVGIPAAYQAKQHPSHYGAGHWQHYDIDIQPVTTTKILMEGNRNFGSRKGGPKDVHGRPAKYSLGIRNLDFGWRVRTKQDVPRTPRDPDIVTENQTFTQTLDYLGSPVNLIMRENRAADLLTGSVWKSEPQPVPYAVVNFYVDARDSGGNSQIIDRFDVTPLQAGATLNLYYSTQIPDSDFGASDAPVTFPMLRPAGEEQPVPATSGITFADKIGYLDIDNQAIQWDPGRPFWVGLEFQPQWGSTNLTPHVILDAGDLQLAWDATGVFRLGFRGGSIFMTPLEFSANSRLHVIIAYDGDRLTFYLAEIGTALNVQSSMVAVNTPTIRLGAELGLSGAPGIYTGFFRLNAMVIKAEPMTFVSGPDGIQVPAAAQGFIADPAVFLDKPEFASDGDGSTDNALLRYLPGFALATGGSAVNPFGFLGGPGTIFEDVIWTPVTRSYKLRAGLLQFPPVAAKFFKFEFTNLTPEPYETFAPLTRTVKTYSQAAVRPKTGPQLTTQVTSSSTSVGLTANIDAAQNSSMFADTPAITNPSDNDVLPTEALTARDLGVQTSLDNVGGMYRFDSWQSGSEAPHYPDTSRHVYEEVQVGHAKRIAYFVGLSDLAMFRVDYSVDDDTDQYLDHFHDRSNIDPDYLTERIVIGTTNVVVNPSFENGITSYTLYTNGTATGGAIATVADGLFGPNALKVSATTLGAVSTDRVGWQQTYTTGLDYNNSIDYSIHVKQVTGAATLRLNVEYYAAGSVFITSDTRSFAPTSTYQRISANMLPPATTVSIKVFWWLEAGAGAAVEYRFDGYQIENLRLTDYCDGTQPGCVWNGTVNNSTSTRAAVSIRPWGWDGENLISNSFTGEPVATISKRFSSQRRVRGVQFATQQSGPVQLVPDPEFADETLAKWRPIGDVVSMEISDDVEATLGRVIKLHRSSALNTWAELRDTYGTYGGIVSSNPAALEPSFFTLQGDQGSVGYGGITMTEPVQVSRAGRVEAAARVWSDHSLSAPLTLQILSASGDVLAQEDQVVQAGRVVEWSVGYTIGETPTGALTWADVMKLDPSPVLPTYGDLAPKKWADLMTITVAQSSQLSVQVVQSSSGDDTFYVDNISLFEDPILWEFSNDDGATWWRALDIRNNPNGVLIFPNFYSPSLTDQTGLRWRVTGYRSNLHVSALDIRPWYAETAFGIPTREAGVSGGPNIQPTDHYPPIADDPYFKQWSLPIPPDWFFVYRQLLLLENATKPVTPVTRPTVFAGPFSMLVPIEPVPPIPPYLDTYTETYPDLYGVANTGSGSYDDDYDDEIYD